MIRAEVVTDVRALEGLREQWEALVARSTNDESTMAPTWLLAWWQVFGADDGRALRVIAVFDRARLIGLAPLALRNRRIGPGLSLRRLELLGSGEDEVDEIASDYLAPLIERGTESSVVTALVDVLAGGAIGPWDELVLAKMSGACPIATLLAAELRARGFGVRFDVTGTSFYVPLPESLDAYLAALPSSRRANVRKALRTFDAWADGNAEIVWAKTPDELERVKEDLVALHAARWESAGKRSLFDSKRFRAFHDAVIPPLFAAGALELGSLRAHGRAVAAVYNVVWRGKVRFYQSGRAVDVPPDVKPGIVLHTHAIERAITLGRCEYDFLPGLVRYKRELALASRPVIELRVARPSVLELARQSAEMAWDCARAWRRSLAHRRGATETARITHRGAASAMSREI